MHVRRRNDEPEVLVLNIMQRFLHVACVMVEHDGERAHDFGSGQPGPLG